MEIVILLYADIPILASNLIEMILNHNQAMCLHLMAAQSV